MPDFIQHGVWGFILGVILIGVLSVIGIPAESIVVMIFLWTMFVFGTLPDVSFIVDWNRHDPRNPFKTYHLTHRYLTRWKVHIWCPFAWAWNLHVWLDLKLHNKLKWWKGWGLVIYIFLWAVLIIILNILNYI